MRAVILAASSAVVWGNWYGLCACCVVVVMLWGEEDGDGDVKTPSQKGGRRARYRKPAPKSLISTQAVWTNKNDRAALRLMHVPASVASCRCRG